MPKIPQYQSTEVLRPNNMGPEAMAQLGYHSERMANTLRSNLNEVGTNYEAQQAKVQTTSMLADMTKLMAQKHTELTDALNQTDPGSGVNPMDKFGEDLGADLDKIGDKYDNPAVKEAFGRLRYDVQTRMLDSGMSQWDTIVQRHTDTSLNSAKDNLANATYVDPASAPANSVIHDTAIDAAVKAGAISQDDAAAKKKEGREVIYNAAAVSGLHSLAGNPNVSISDMAKLKQLYSGPDFQKNMSPADFQRVNDDLDKMFGDRKDAASLYLEKSFPDYHDQVIKYGDPDGRVARVAGVVTGNKPEDIAKDAARVDTYNSWLSEHKVYQDIGNLPAPQVQQYIAAKAQDLANAKSPDEVKSATTAYNAAVKLSKERDEQFHKDPSGWTIQNDDTAGKLYSDYQNNATPQTFQKYALYSAAKQEKLYPGETPQVLTADMKRDIQGKLSQVDQTPQGALAAAATLNQLQTLTGSYYTGAVHELMHDKILRPDQYVAGTLIARPESRMLAQEVLQSAAVPKDTMDKTSPLSEAAALGIARSAFAPLATTMKGTVNGDDLLDAYISSAADVLRQRAVNGGSQYLGTKHTGAVAGDATQIANQMVLGRIQVKNGMRIPTGMDADDVTQGAQGVLGDLGNHALLSPPGYAGLINGKDQYAKDIQSDGYWVTNPKGDGAILYFQGAAVQEKGPKGVVQTVSLPFAQMEKLGRESRSTPNKVGRFFTNPGSL